MQPWMVSDGRALAPGPGYLDTTNLFWFFSPPEICAKNSSEPPFSMTSVLESLEELASSPCSTSSTLRFLSALTDSAIAFQIQAQFCARDTILCPPRRRGWSGQQKSQLNWTLSHPRPYFVRCQRGEFRKVEEERRKRQIFSHQGVVSLSCVFVSRPGGTLP